MKNSTNYQRIYEMVRQIPRGTVATYGQIARLAGLAGHARQVGYALHALKDQAVPWHRVINAQGAISARSIPYYEKRQRHLLEEEGIKFSPQSKVSLALFQWKPLRDPKI